MELAGYLSTFFFFDKKRNEKRFFFCCFSSYTQEFGERHTLPRWKKMQAQATEHGPLCGYTNTRGEFFPSVMDIFKEVLHVKDHAAKAEWQKIKDISKDSTSKYHKESCIIVEGTMLTRGKVQRFFVTFWQ